MRTAVAASAPMTWIPSFDAVPQSFDAVPQRRMRQKSASGGEFHYYVPAGIWGCQPK
jgi:hypothetical protein